jgi:hypothetical protein
VTGKRSHGCFLCSFYYYMVGMRNGRVGGVFWIFQKDYNQIKTDKRGCVNKDIGSGE